MLANLRCPALILAFAVWVSVGGAAIAAAPPLSVYGNLPGVERAAISATGDKVALIGMVGDQRTLVVMDQDKKPLRTLPLGDAKIRGLYWAGDDRLLLAKSETVKLGAGYSGNRTELSTMLVIPVDDPKIWMIFENNPRIAGVVQGFYGIQQREGRYFGYFGGIAMDGDFRSGPYLKSTATALFEVDLQNGKATMIAPRYDGAGFRDWALGAAGRLRASLDFDSRSGAWTIRNAEGRQIAEGTNRLGRVSLIGLGASPATVILAEEREDDQERWLEIPEAGGEAREILPDASIDAAYLDENTRQLFGWREEGDVPSYRFSDAFRQKVVNATLKAFPGLLVHIKGWNAGFDRLLVMTEGAGDPQTWWRVDIRTGKARELGTSYPMDGADVGPMRMVRYKAADGLEIAGVLTLPPGRDPKNLPVVILPHGGPSSRDYPGFDWWAQAFASRGYAVLQPNFRGSTGYGVAFRRAGNREWGRKMQSDISDGLADLSTQGIVDPTRACIVGASYGGYAALAGVTLQQGLYRCAVAVAGVSDVAKMAITDIRESGFDRTMKAALAQEVGAKSDLRAISPVTFAARADAPVLLIHGKDDLVVPFEQSRMMEAALQAAGKPVELLALPGEDHWLSRNATRLTMLEASVGFVMKHNPPDPAP